MAQSECIAFSFFSRFVLDRRFQSELKKETNVCFFRATKVLKKHRLLAVKYYTHVSFYHRIEQQFGTRFCAQHFRFSEEDEYIDRAKRRIVVVVVSFELFETTVASVSIALLVLVYVKPGW